TPFSGSSTPDPSSSTSAPTGASARRFLTSDLAELGPDGALTVLGRADDVIITGGRKVLPQDVERAVDRSLMLRGMGRASAAVGVDDPEGGQRVEALLTLDDGLAPAEATALVGDALRSSEWPGHVMPNRVHWLERIPALRL